MKRSRENIQKKLSRLLGQNIADFIAFESVMDPRGIENNTNSYQGALYGAASNNKFSAFLRHPNFTQKISNLYFCGGSVHLRRNSPVFIIRKNSVRTHYKKSGMTVKFKLAFSIFLIWLFNISGIFGILSEESEWFLAMTPLNLFLYLVFITWNLKDFKHLCLCLCNIISYWLCDRISRSKLRIYLW